MSDFLLQASAGFLPADPRLQDLYLRCDAPVRPEGTGTRVPQGATARADTYFSGFSLYYWARKTRLDAVRLVLEIERGRGRIALFHADASGTRALGAPLSFDAAGPSALELPFSVQALQTGLVFWQITADSDVVLGAARYVTAEAPVREVRLGIVVTTFRREAAARETMARFAASGLAARGHGLLMVDNGASLASDAPQGVRVIANANLGGAGGFSRGLMEMRAEEKATHVLFMDDDASTHMACIDKAIAFLAFATSDRLAVCGTMFLEEVPWRQLDAGARVRPGFGLTALKAQRDMRRRANLLVNEDDAEAHYGGWWFFAFKLDQAKELAFPFFVRGDDVLFGLRHDFDVIAPSAVASWQPSFESKVSPSTEYLAHRSEFMVGLLRPDDPEAPLGPLIRRAFRLVLGEAGGFRYDIAEARCRAMEDVLKGPGFFGDNPSAIARLAVLRAELAADYPRPMARESLPDALPFSRAREPKWRRVLRRFTFDGHLLPAPLAREERLLHGLGLDRAAGLFAGGVTFYSPQAGTGFTTRRSLRRYIALRLRLARIARSVRRHGEQVAQDYRDALPHLTSEAYWREALDLDRP